jgi:hypothetical protein
MSSSLVAALVASSSRSRCSSVVGAACDALGGVTAPRRLERVRGRKRQRTHLETVSREESLSSPII